MTNPMSQEIPTLARDEKRHEVQAYDLASQAYLVARAQNGCSASFDLLCAPHRTRLLKIAFRITRNNEDAEDAVQDSLMRAFMRINEFRGASSFSTWLTRIVINAALMILRKTQSAHYLSLDSESEPTGHLNFEIEDSALNPERILLTQERRRALRRAISNLRPRVRAVLELGPLRESSMKETANVVNISTAAAKARLFHGFAALRKSTALRAVGRPGSKTAA